uniref:Small ribosomal subunit protein bS18c n=1 Tax=Tetraselmis sp. GSL018 TaxID=582737 RepID=A0A061QZJ3_9CHLO
MSLRKLVAKLSSRCCVTLQGELRTLQGLELRRTDRVSSIGNQDFSNFIGWRAASNYGNVGEDWDEFCGTKSPTVENSDDDKSFGDKSLNKPSDVEDSPQKPALKGNWRDWIENKLSEMEQATETKAEEGTAGSPQGPSSNAVSGAAMDPPPLQQQQKQQKQQERVEPLAHPFYGYAELGASARKPSFDKGSVAEDGGISSLLDPLGGPAESPPRLHPSRLFYPGQVYSSEELSPFYSEPAEPRPVKAERRPAPRDEDVRAQIDFKDRRFLSSFLSEQGQLLPRRRTRLRKKTHRKVMRAVKLARCMALLPFTSKLPQYERRKNPYSSRSR